MSCGLGSARDAAESALSTSALSSSPKDGMHGQYLQVHHWGQHEIRAILPEVAARSKISSAVLLRRPAASPASAIASLERHSVAVSGRGTRERVSKSQSKKVNGTGSRWYKAWIYMLVWSADAIRCFRGGGACEVVKGLRVEHKREA